MYCKPPVNSKARCSSCCNVLLLTDRCISYNALEVEPAAAPRLVALEENVFNPSAALVAAVSTLSNPSVIVCAPVSTASANCSAVILPCSNMRINSCVEYVASCIELSNSVVCA